jgi:hypothetical protein
MKKLFILFLVAIILAGCERRSILNYDIEGRDMLLTKKTEEKIKEIEKNAEEKIKEIKEIEKNVEKKVKKIKGKPNKESDSDQQKTPIKEAGTEANESEVHKPFSKYAYPLSAMIAGSSASFIGYKISNYKTFFTGLLVASAGAFSGIKRLLETSDSEQEKDE